jgi:homoserine O-acetyltransferase
MVLPDFQIYELGDVALQCGETLRAAQLAYKTHGTLNAARDNAVVFPTFFSADHVANEPMIGPDMALDPERYFIIVPNLFGNGLSSSPSNTDSPHNAGRFPVVSYFDNVSFQHRLVTENFGIERVALVCGFSMGAMQSFHWGAMYPEVVDRIAPWCGSARTSRHNYVFLEGVKAALRADSNWNEGEYAEQPAKGVRAAARVYAGWGPSQAFYRENVYLEMGFDSVEDYIVKAWEDRFLGIDANDLLAMVATWQAGDISANPLYQGSFEKALGSIKARALVMPSRTDQYFPPEDSEIEVSLMPNAELRIIPSIWGHLAGGPGRNPVDTQFLDEALKELLTS